MSWHPKRNCSYELSGSTFGFTKQEFSMVGGYTENLEKPQKCQNWGVGACSGMGAYSGQYGIIRNTEVRKNIVIVYGN